MQILFTALALLSSSIANAAICSRTLTFADGTVLTAAQLNAEFNAITNCANSLNDDNIASAANILPAKLNATIAGDGIARDGTTGVLSVGVDGSTIEISSDALRLKDAGITGAKLGVTAADASSLEVASGSMRIKDSGVTTAKINDSAVTTAKIADGNVTDIKRAALNIQTSSGSGTFTTTSTSYVDVTNLSVTITTVGRPVFIAVVPATDGDAVGVTPSFGSTCFVEFNKANSSLVRQYLLSSGGIMSSPYIDAAAAGTHTYKVRVRTLAANQCNAINLKLIAYEL